MIPLPENPRILVTRTDRIGDLVVSTPVFDALRRKFPKAWIAALVFTENRELVEGNPALDEVILYDKKGRERGGFGNWRLGRALARKRFDAVIHLHATNRMHWLGWLAGIPVRAGWDRKSAHRLTHRLPDIKVRGEKHEALYNFELLRLFGVEAPEKLEPCFPVTDNAVRSVRELVFQLGLPQDRPLCVLHPSASCPSKRWPASRFAEVAAQVRQKYGAEVAVIGGAADGALAKMIERESGVPVWNFCGRVGLGGLGVLLREAAVLVSNDSGPVHIASAVGTPVISVFGRNQPGLSPARWKPLGPNARVLWRDVGCNPCLAHACHIHFLCLDVIPSSEVMRELESLGPSLWNKYPFQTADAVEAGHS